MQHASETIRNGWTGCTCLRCLREIATYIVEDYELDELRLDAYREVRDRLSD